MRDFEHRLPQQRRLNGTLPGPASKALMERRSTAVSAGVSSSVPAYAVDLDGGIILDADGNSLIDLGSGIAVTTVGGSHPDVVAAVQRAVGHFTHTCFMITPYEGYVAVCEKLAALAPGDHAKKVALFNSGAEAVENAVKIARHATKRTAVVAFEHAYHGRTNLTMAMTGKSMPYKAGFGPFASDVYRVPTSYPFRDPDGMTGDEAAERAITLISTQVGADAVACVVIEPIMGEGGFIVPAKGFLERLSAWCSENGIVFVADEVQAGICRTGNWFACQEWGIVPDLITVAKGMGGGMPISGVIGRSEMMDAVHLGGLGGTYGGNPVSCAASLAALNVMQRDDLAGRAREIEAIIREILEPVAAASPIVGELRGRGAMMALEFVQPGGKQPNAAAVKAVLAACLTEGVVALSCGTFGNNIRLLPPITMPEALLRDGLGVLARAIEGAGR